MVSGENSRASLESFVVLSQSSIIIGLSKMLERCAYRERNASVGRLKLGPGVPSLK